MHSDPLTALVLMALGLFLIIMALKGGNNETTQTKDPPPHL